MKNYVQEGRALYVPAPANVLSGQAAQIGSLFGIFGEDALSGVLVAYWTEGVYTLPKLSAQAWAIGDSLYWDSGNAWLTNVAGNFAKVGKATAVAGNPTATGQIKLDPSGAGTGGGVGAASGATRIASGQKTTVTATDTISTGLNTVVGVVASFDSDIGDNPEFVTATIGDQAGAPAAGSIILKTWQNTSGSDPTPVAATTFGKKVNWIAFGT